MKQKTKNLSFGQFRKLFPDNDVCLGTILNMRYGGENLDCPKCKRKTVYYRIKNRKCYECGECSNQIYPLAGTIMEGTTTELVLWFYAMYMFSTSKNGVSAKELERAIGVTYKTAWRIGHKIREAMGKGEDRIMKGIIEIDEALIGGAVRGGKRGWGAENKTCLFGIIERGGNVKVTPVENRERVNIMPLVRKHIEKGSVVNSDEFKTYHTLGEEGYDHRTVVHSKYQWAQGENYTNSIEGYWSNLKKSILGTHTYVSPKHMQKYLDEFDFRHNHRNNEVIFNEILKRAGMMTDTQVEENAWKLSDLYHETIIGKTDHEQEISRLVEQLKQEGYRFELLHSDHIADMYDRLQMVKRDKSKAVHDNWFEHASNLRDEELRLKEKLEELVYFTTGKDRTINFICAREQDEWIWKQRFIFR